jgi:Type VI secretion system/phage-baseplate injector OB domain
MLNITQDLAERPGLDANKTYVAVVVNDNDPEHLQRIKARVETIFDGIPDDALPWAIPSRDHSDGGSATTGSVNIPKVGSKVHVRFQKGSPLHPIYYGYHVDKQTILEECKLNYPHRTVHRFKNGALAVLDTQANELYLRDPGNLKIYVAGNVELHVGGNIDEIVEGNVRRHIKGNLDEKIDGGVTRTVGGALEETASNIHQHAQGTSAYSAGGSFVAYGSGSATLESGGVVTIEGSQIQENPHGGSSNPGTPGNAQGAQLTEWPGIPGGETGN